MTTRVLWLIEDENPKARTLARIARQARPDLEVVRLHSLQEWLDVLRGSTVHRKALEPTLVREERWAGVITDWSFPRRDGEAPTAVGNSVLKSLDGTGIPRIVVSGSDRPVGFTQAFGTIDWLSLGDVEPLRKWLADL